MHLLIVEILQLIYLYSYSLVAFSSSCLNTTTTTFVNLFKEHLVVEFSDAEDHARACDEL